MAHELTRREMLKRAAALGTATAVPVRSIAQPDQPAEYSNFTASESRALEAIVARLIPADENGPGALEAGAVQYIDRALSDALAASLEAYRSGLAAIDDYARSTAAEPFADLPPDRQDSVLSDVERNIASGFTPDASSFFELVMSHTIEGTFCDPEYGGNRGFIGWELIGYPGIRLGVGPDQQRMSARLETTRVSAYDLPMFDPLDSAGGRDR